MAYKDIEKRKEYMREYSKKHYENNKELYKQRAVENTKRYRKEVREYIREIKSTSPCADCHHLFHYCVMDFDHVDGEKEGNVSKLAIKGSMKLIIEEIEKCEVVCANCHRLRSFARMEKR